MDSDPDTMTVFTDIFDRSIASLEENILEHEQKYSGAVVKGALEETFMICYERYVQGRFPKEDEDAHIATTIGVVLDSRDFDSIMPSDIEAIHKIYDELKPEYE